MSDFLRELFAFVLLIFAIVLIVVVCISIIALPPLWLKGRARSHWIEETRGIELPWYEAAFIETNANSIDGEISIENKESE